MWDIIISLFYHHACKRYVAAARRQHTRGFMLWNPEGVYTRDALSG